MTAIPIQITSGWSDVAAVVTGAQQLPLTGQERHYAIQAMYALDRRVEDIQAALCISRRWLLVKCAKTAGVDLTEPQPLDEGAVEFVCQGTPMRLANAERDEVIRRIGRRHSAAELGRLTGHTSTAVSAAASRLGVRLRKPNENCWWHTYIEAHRARPTVAA